MDDNANGTSFRQKRSDKKSEQMLIKRATASI